MIPLYEFLCARCRTSYYSFSPDNRFDNDLYKELKLCSDCIKAVKEEKTLEVEVFKFKSGRKE